MGEGAGPGRPGDTEVDDPGALGGEEDVRRLQVPVDDTGLVHRHQPLRQGGPDRGHLGGRERTLLGDLVVERGAGHVLRREPGAVRFQVGGHQTGRTAAADPPGGRHLACEAGAELLILRQVRPDHLERHPLAPAVGTQVDDAHATRAEPPVQPERSDDTRILAPEPHHRHRLPIPAAGPPDEAQLTYPARGALRGRALVGASIVSARWEDRRVVREPVIQVPWPVRDLKGPSQKGDWIDEGRSCGNSRGRG